MSSELIYWFDMDHTLINNDCDVSWKHFMIAEGLAEKAETERLTQKFFDDYNAGCLDINEFLDFQLKEFAGRTVEEMAALTAKHFEVMVKDKVYKDAFELCRQVLAAGHRTAIVTSTNSVIARPIARYFGIEELFGAELEIVDGRYTGHACGNYPVGPGKAETLKGYCQRYDLDPQNFAYYGDSINDRYILEAVGHPHAVNPSDSLRELALKNNWQIIQFK